MALPYRTIEPSNRNLPSEVTVGWSWGSDPQTKPGAQSYFIR